MAADDAAAATELSQMLECPFPLVSGEKYVRAWETAVHHCPFNGRESGSIHLTNFKLMFIRSASAAPKFDWRSRGSFVGDLDDISGFELRLGLIHRVTVNEDAVHVACHDFRDHVLGVGSDAQGFADALSALAFPLSYGGTLPAFLYREKFDIDGWKYSDPRADLDRLGVSSSSAWRITEANKEFSLCPSYGAYLAVPAERTDEQILACAQYRSKARLPILSYLHKNGAAISRASQPLVGAMRRTSTADEEMLNAVRLATVNAKTEVPAMRSVGPDGATSHIEPLARSASPTTLYIIDARPKVNAIANAARGGGFEDTTNYESTDIVFMDIHNIHVMRSSLRQLRDACFPLVAEDAKDAADPHAAVDPTWYRQLDASHWLHHVRLVVSGALQVAELVAKGSPVFVHCSDGWDRSSQLTSLAMLLIDPYYRTLEGLAVLIEREWVLSGHMFALRIGHGLVASKETKENERSPIFIQFLDVLFQLIEQFPAAFEFNKLLLALLADEVYACRFGNFLFTTESARAQANVREKTVSIWAYVLSSKNKSRFTNPSYVATDALLRPATSLKWMRLWSDYYLRWVPAMPAQSDPAMIEMEMDRTLQELNSRLAAIQASA